MWVKKNKLMIILLFSIPIIMILSSCSLSENRAQNSRLTKIVEDQVYVEKSPKGNKVYSLFTSSGTYISYDDNGAQYATQDDLKEAEIDNEMGIYPYREYVTGNYEKKGDFYRVTIKSVVTLYSKDIKSYQKGEYSVMKKENQTIRFTIEKDNTGYKVNDVYFNAKKSKTNLPQTIEDFISQYDYKPENLN
ncbi:hypothetical protein DDV21_004715 [Streptococcus chenjunshii]|uniref:Lipoprotein n=1 Tax=Streptococcus chenjunshii TaxID=2173853 RepID=A0A372KIQ8_9STRE|nr:hypothetical protein [Streptococcus chenjunshii]AXQ78428.1 hypothetical protein DDV21_004715 [Streptococcus chenjunshii]RFU49963.1 hypothetical protein DDV22_11160 [Streptococcus chenjunshii]RFU52159.1 hypothetical protein DDV23_11155 [Streptococcus chenjunshii]